ncbi:MAG: hypothetical protein WCI74_01340 [Actinomycetes bacterium]
MRFSPRAFGSALAALALAAVLVGTAFAAGCSSGASTAASTAGSAEATAGTFPATTPNPGQQPPPPALQDPRTAVYSYQLWISYAYRVLNSDVASRTFDSEEEVRVNSYVMYNFQEGRAIDQRLLVANVKAWESQGSTATVAMHEEWAYRYISTATGKYTSPVQNASYETTYTLIRLNDNWVVHSVQAAPTGGPIK